jgi:RNA polymerase sigma-70 factor (ECF subfamily)
MTNLRCPQRRTKKLVPIDKYPVAVCGLIEHGRIRSMHLSLFRHNRQEQVAKIYSELAPALLAYARSFGLDHATGEDTVQRTFLALLEGGKWPSEPRPYLFRAVRNASLNQMRGRSRKVEFLFDEHWFESDRAHDAEELDLRHALKQLPADQREVVMMHVWGGLSFRETADVLGISANTAASRYRYAIAALKRLLLTNATAEEL